MLHAPTQEKDRIEVDEDKKSDEVRFISGEIIEDADSAEPTLHGTLKEDTTACYGPRSRR